MTGGGPSFVVAERVGGKDAEKGMGGVAIRSGYDDDECEVVSQRCVGNRSGNATVTADDTVPTTTVFARSGPMNGAWIVNVVATVMPLIRIIHKAPQVY